MPNNRRTKRSTKAARPSKADLERLGRDAFVDIVSADREERAIARRVERLNSKHKLEARQEAPDRIEKALMNLACARDLAQQIENGEDFAYNPEYVALWIRLVIIESGREIEQACAALGQTPGYWFAERPRERAADQTP